MSKTVAEIKAALANIADQLEVMAVATRETAQLNDADEVERTIGEAIASLGSLRTAYRELLPEGMAQTLAITLGIEGDADAALEAIDGAIDAGTLQDAIVEACDGVDEFRITTALATYP